ncbi:MAG TPA: universal stress protein [Actinomycetota bacterium]|nr:universal stress protein [Actinomycetota bacterium]
MIERIVLAVDGSERSARAVERAAEIAERFGAVVTVVHVNETTTSWGVGFDPTIVSDETGAALVDGVVRDLKDRGISALGEVRTAPTGIVPDEIVDVAREADASMIVMGTRGLSDLKGLMLGSVAHGVLRLAHCPVLVVR